MSTATLQQGRTVAEVLARARTTVYLARLVLGLLTWAIVSGATWLTLFGLDNLFRLPGGLRFPLAVTAAGITLVSLWTNVIRRAFDRKTPAEIAVLLEQKYGIGDNVLINSLQFGEGEYDERQRPFIEETIGAGTLGLAAVSLRELWQPAQVSKWALVLGAVLVGWLTYTALAPRHARNALDRYLYSLADVPPVGSVELTITPAADVTIAERDDLRVTVKVDGLDEGDKLASYPELFWKEGTTAVDSQPTGASRVVMQPVVGQANLYAHTFANIRRNFAFRVFARDSYSRSTQVIVAPAPRIAEGQFRVTPPAYIGSGPTTHMGPPHPVSGLPGSKLAIEIKLDQAAKALRWKTGDEVHDFKEDGGVWRAETTVTVARPYEVEVEGNGLERPVTIASGVISLLSDRPPQVEFVQNAMSWTVLPGERVPLRLRAEDDHGLKDLKLTIKSAYGGSPPVTVKTWDFGAAPGRKGRVDESMDLSIDAALFAPGGKYVVEVSCTDFCPDNPPAVSRPVLIEVKSLDKLEMPNDPRASDVYGALDRAIALQKRALDATRTLGSHMDDVWLNLSGKPRAPEEVQKLLEAHRGQILGNQRDVRTTLLGVAAKGITGDHKRIVERMRQLGETEAVQANDRAFAVTLPPVSAAGLKPAPVQYIAPAPERQKIALPPTRARYVALVILTTHGWQDKALVQDVNVLDRDGMGAAKDAPTWTVIASRGGDKVAETFPRDRRWQPSGRAPYYVVIDLGSVRLVNGLTLLPAAVDASQGPKDIQIYLSVTPLSLNAPELTKERLGAEVRPLESVQETIYNELVALKGQEAKKAQQEKDQLAKKALGEGIESAPSARDVMKKFVDELKDWTKEHEKNAAKRKSIMDKPSQDFSDKDAAELGQLVTEKRKQARKLEDMVLDLVNAGAMDFADTKTAKTLAKMMDQAKDLKDLAKEAAKYDETEYTYNLDTAMTSQAKEIVKGTEDTTHVEPTPGSGESPEDKKNLPYLQELPTELPVTVPPLLQKLDELYEKIKQGGLSLANSVDDTEGPIGPSTFSGTSASGKMGDATPDQKFDRTGRSNVGRTGKSDGQMVGSSAPAIKDEEIGVPERMSNSPLESGKEIDDKSGNPATSQGLGKGTNSLTEFGKNGKLPPELNKKLKMVLKEAEEVRGSAHDLMLKLQRHRMPTADLKMAIQRLDQATAALKRGDGVGILQARDEAVRYLQATQKQIVEQVELRQAERAQQLQRQRDMAGPATEADPRGYEEIIGAYFRQIAERK